MRVGIYLDEWNPTKGGAFSFVKEVYERLLEIPTSHEFIPILLEPDLCENGIVLKTLDALPQRSFVQKLLRRTVPAPNRRAQERVVTEQLQANEIDLLYSPNFRVPTTELPFFVTCWDLQHRLQPYFPAFSSQIPGTWNWLSRDVHYRHVLPRATKVIVGTSRGAEEVGLFYGIAKERIARIPFPPPLRFKDLKSSRPLSLESEDFVFYPAQFWPHKDHSALVRAISVLKVKHNLEVSLVLSGTDKGFGTVEHVKKLARELDVSDQVEFLGFVSEAELKWLYENAIALTFASHFGPDNLPPLEAFVLGCPVIATNVEGAEEQLGDAALLVERGDYNAFADNVRAILRKSIDVERLIAKGQNRVAELSKESYAEALIRHIDEFEPVVRTWK